MSNERSVNGRRVPSAGQVAGADHSDFVEGLAGVYSGDAGRWVVQLREGSSQGAIAWARVSTDRQEEKGLSIPEQLREMRSYAEREGIEIVHEFQEAASAFQDEGKRVEFHRMLATAKADPRVSLILVHDFSRFSRDSLRAKVLVTELRAAGVRLVSLNDPVVDTDTAVGVYMEAITFAKNEAYSREIGFHVRKGCRANVQTRDPETGWCYKNGGEPPWGYRAVNVERGKRRNRPIIKRLWELDDTVISGRPVHEWVRHCLVEMAAKGATLRELSTFCKQHQLLTRRGTLVETTWASRLDAPRLLQYAGYGVWGVSSRRRVVHPPSEWLIVPDAHPAIITPGEAISIAETRREVNGSAFTTGRNAHHRLGGGIFRCARCGQSMVKSHDSYICATKHRQAKRGTCANGPYVKISQIDSDVAAGISDLLDVLSDRGNSLATINRELATAWERARDSGSRAKQAVLEAERLCADSDAFLGHAMSGVGPPQRGRLRLVPELSMIGPELPGRAPQISTALAARYARRARKAVASPDRLERKRLFRRLVKVIELDPERLEAKVIFRVPDDVTIPRGSGDWCAANSALLRSATRRTYQVRPSRKWLTLRSRREACGLPGRHGQTGSGELG